jgi:hypothetical protein
MGKNKEEIERVEELPIEEFENDNQDILEEFKKRFKDKKDSKVKNKDNNIKKGYESWL